MKKKKRSFATHRLVAVVQSLGPRRGCTGDGLTMIGAIGGDILGIDERRYSRIVTFFENDAVYS